MLSFNEVAGVRDAGLLEGDMLAGTLDGDEDMLAGALDGDEDMLAAGDADGVGLGPPFERRTVADVLSYAPALLSHVTVTPMSEAVHDCPVANLARILVVELRLVVLVLTQHVVVPMKSACSTVYTVPEVADGSSTR